MARKQLVKKILKENNVDVKDLFYDNPSQIIVEMIPDMEKYFDKGWFSGDMKKKIDHVYRYDLVYKKYPFQLVIRIPAEVSECMKMCLPIPKHISFYNISIDLTGRTYDVLHFVTKHGLVGVMPSRRFQSTLIRSDDYIENEVIDIVGRVIDMINNLDKLPNMIFEYIEAVIDDARKLGLVK